MPETQKTEIQTKTQNVCTSLGWLDLRVCQKRKKQEIETKTQTTPVIINLNEVGALSAPFNVAEPELSEEKPTLEIHLSYNYRVFMERAFS